MVSPSIRAALTTLQLVVAIGIAAIIASFALSAIQIARIASLRAESANKLRQIILATHDYSAANSDSVPAFDASYAMDGGEGVFYSILPYISEGNALPRIAELPGFKYIPAYVSPADTSFHVHLVEDIENGGVRHLFGDISFALNWQGFRPHYNLMASYQDGVSSTIAFTERYSLCGKTGSIWSWGSAPCLDVQNEVFCKCVNSPPMRCATFADANYDDILPITSGGVTNPSLLGKSFQLAPKIADCDYRIPQSPFPSAMTVAFFDGSIRSLRGSVAPPVFWSAVTPAGDESISIDW